MEMKMSPKLKAMPFNLRKEMSSRDCFSVCDLQESKGLVCGPSNLNHYNLKEKHHSLA